LFPSLIFLFFDILQLQFLLQLLLLSAKVTSFHLLTLVSRTEFCAKISNKKDFLACKDLNRKFGFSAGVPTVAGWYNACVSIFGTLKQHLESRRSHSNEEVEMVIRESFRM